MKMRWKKLLLVGVIVLFVLGCELMPQAEPAPAAPESANFSAAAYPGTPAARTELRRRRSRLEARHGNGDRACQLAVTG